MSLVSLGCNNFGGHPTTAPNGTVYGALDLAQTREVVHAALDDGINLFDTADVYATGGSERFLGEILRGHRHQVVIATKWGSGIEPGQAIAWGSRGYIRLAIDASLQRLQTDYIDLYQLHWPDPLTPIAETIDALDELAREGKLRFTGSSHFTGQQVIEADRYARGTGKLRFNAAQNHYSLLERSAESELLPACAERGVGLLPYFPLANGLLAGKYRRGVAAVGRLAGREIGADVFDLIEALAAYALARGRTMVDVAVGALAARAAVSSVITGATRPEQIRINAAAADWQPTADDLAQLGALLKAHPVTAAHVQA